MRCYFDESWQINKSGEKIGVLFGFLIPKNHIMDLDNLMYSTRKKYFGIEHAKDKTKELKGNKLLSNYTFKIAKKNKEAIVKNHCVVKEIISWLDKQRSSFQPKLFCSIVYGPDPNLKCMNPKNLELPFKDLCIKISSAAYSIDKESNVSLIFDQRLGVQIDIAISIYNFIAGSNLKNLNPHPYFAVSNVDPGVQVADIFGYIVGKKACGDDKFKKWYNDLKKFQWNGYITDKKRWGFQRYDSKEDGTCRIRKSW